MAVKVVFNLKPMMITLEDLNYIEQFHRLRIKESMHEFPHLYEGKHLKKFFMMLQRILDMHVILLEKVTLFTILIGGKKFFITFLHIKHSKLQLEVAHFLKIKLRKSYRVRFRTDHQVFCSLEFS